MPKTYENLKRFCQRCRESRIVFWNQPGTSRYCAPCLKKVEKQEPTEAQRNSLTRRKQRRKHKVAAALAWLDDYKAQLGCFFCPETDPICLDCHHEDPNSKTMALSRLVRLKPDLELLKKELLKCKVICANCHRKHHQKLRRGDTEEVKLVIEASELTSRRERIQPPRPPGFSEAMEELRLKCFPPPKQPATYIPAISSLEYATQQPSASPEHVGTFGAASDSLDGIPDDDEVFDDTRELADELS